MARNRRTLRTISLMLLLTMSTMTLPTITLEYARLSCDAMYHRPSWVSGDPSACSLRLPCDPFPLHDDLTEDVRLVWDEGEIYLRANCCGVTGYWHELTGQYPDMLLQKDHRDDSIGDWSIIDAIDCCPAFHQLTFYFDYEVNLTAYYYIKYYQAISSEQTGFCSFRFFTTQGYYAFVNYYQTPDNRFRRQCWNLHAGYWTIQPGFDWATVKGFMFTTRATERPSALWIDGLKIYGRLTEDPLPGDIIDEAEYKAKYTRMLAQMIYCGTNNGLDYWLTKIFLVDFHYLSLPSDAKLSLHPSHVRVWLRLPEICDANEPSWFPQGYVGPAQTSVSLSWGSLGFSISPPARYSSTTSKAENGMLNFEWNCEPSYNILGTTSGCIFLDYCEFAFCFRTAIGFKPWAFVASEIKMFSPTVLVNWWPFWNYNCTETLRWQYLDPPGSEPLEPGTTEPTTTPETLYVVCFNEAKISDAAGNSRMEFKQGSYVRLYVNYTYWIPNTSMCCIDARIYDSYGNAMSWTTLRFCAGPGECVLQSTKSFGTTMGIPADAQLGQARLIVRILPDWPETYSEYARIEIDGIQINRLR